MLKWGASQALWSQRNIFTINFFFSVQQMPSNEHLFYPSEKEHVYSWISCHIDRKSHLVWTLKRVICTHHCRTEALLCCWEFNALVSAAALTQFHFWILTWKQSHCRFVGGAEHKDRQVLLWRITTFFPLCPTNAVQVKAVIKSTYFILWETSITVSLPATDRWGSSFTLDKIKPVSSCFSPAEQVHHPVMNLRFAQSVDTNTLCKYLQEFLLNSRDYWETGIL